MSIFHLPRRQFLAAIVWLAGGVVASSCIVVALWHLGRRTRSTAATTHRVTGGSMAPTLWGEHFDVTCPHCRIQFKMDGSPTSSLMNSSRGQDTSKSIPCWHCGFNNDRPTGMPNPGELIRVEPVSGSKKLTKGQLVVIRVDDALHVKRLLGLPGEVVSLADQPAAPPRLCCNGQLAPAPETTIAVDRDELRDVSRWSAGDPKPNEVDAQHPIDTWQRVRGQWQCSATSEPSAELIYTHRSVHDFDQVSAVLDDCPANALLIRSLYPVSTLMLSLRMNCSNSVRLMTSLGERDFDRGVHDVELRGATDQLKLAVIAVDAECSVTIEGLALDREIDFRLRPSDELSTYPMTLGPNEYFVVGDNVPIAVDSRNFGPIRSDQIIGFVR